MTQPTQLNKTSSSYPLTSRQQEEAPRSRSPAPLLNTPPPSRRKSVSPAPSERSSSAGDIRTEKATEGRLASISPGQRGRQGRSPFRTNVKQEPAPASSSHSGSPPTWKKDRSERRPLGTRSKKKKKGPSARGAKNRGGVNRAAKDRYVQVNGRFSKAWRQQPQTGPSRGAYKGKG